MVANTMNFKNREKVYDLKAVDKKINESIKVTGNELDNSTKK